MNAGEGQLIKINSQVSATDGERADQIRIENCVMDAFVGSGTTANSQVDGLFIENDVHTVFVTNTSFIRCRRGVNVGVGWTGNFLYFQNVEAERAIKEGFLIGGTGNFVTMDNIFSSTNESHGVHITSAENSSVNMTNPNIRDNVGHGILMDGTSNNLSVVNPAIGGNSRGSSGTNHGITIGSNSNNVYIAGGKIGGDTDDLSGTGTQGRGINIDGSTHSNIRIIGTNVTGNVTNASEGIGQNITGGTGNKVQFNSGSSVSLNT